jgi:TolA-binding protein
MHRKKSKIFLALLVTIFPALLRAQVADASILFAKGFDLFKQGMYIEAAEAFSALSAQEENSALVGDADYMQVISMVNASRAEEADVLADRFLLRHPDSPNVSEIYYQKGRAAFIGGRFGDAIALFERFMADYPESPTFPSALFWHSEAYYMLGRTGEAREGFARLVDRFPSAAKRDVAEWRLEVIGLEAREGKLKRILEFDRSEAIQRQTSAEDMEKYSEHEKERMYILIRSLRAAYGLPGIWKVPLYAEKIPLEQVAPLPIPETLPVPVVEAAPTPAPPPPVDTSQQEANALELLRLNRLKDLLTAKSKTLRLLAEALQKFAAEVTK